MTIRESAYTLELTSEELNLICTSLNASYLSICEEYKRMKEENENESVLIAQRKKGTAIRDLGKGIADYIGRKFIEEKEQI